MFVSNFSAETEGTMVEAAGKADVGLRGWQMMLWKEVSYCLDTFLTSLLSSQSESIVTSGGEVEQIKRGV